MVIRHTTKTMAKKFENIVTGSCFVANDDCGNECTYMKIPAIIDEDGNTLNAVDLDFGMLTTFEDDDVVEKVDAIVTIERYGY